MEQRQRDADIERGRRDDDYRRPRDDDGKSTGGRYKREFASMPATTRRRQSTSGAHITVAAELNNDAADT